jgi:hypothetical protein
MEKHAGVPAMLGHFSARWWYYGAFYVRNVLGSYAKDRGTQ